MKSERDKFCINTRSAYSGRGGIHEYFHFLVDFSIPLYYHTQYRGGIYNRSVVESHIYCYENYPYMYKFKNSKGRDAGWKHHPFDLNNLRTMKEHYEYIFENKLNFIITREDIIKRHMCTDIILHDINDTVLTNEDGLRRRGSWGKRPFEQYDCFKRSILERYKIPAVGYNDKKVIIIKRGMRKGMKWHGTDRRGKPDEWYEKLKIQFNNKGIPSEVVVFDNMKLSDQISTIRSASAVVGQHGGGLTNMVFADPGTLIIEYDKAVLPCYSLMAESCRLPFIALGEKQHWRHITTIVDSVHTHYSQVHTRE